MKINENAWFYAFKPSGKWKYSGRGWLSAKVFESFNQEEKINQILEDNGGCWPGTNSKMEDMTLIVIPDEDCPHGWPQMYVREPWK